MRLWGFAFAAFVLAGPAFADDITLGAVLGATPEDIRANLTAMGYDVRKMEFEDGEIEVKMVKGIAMIELHVNRASGQVVEIEYE
jgi:hypothetical protein